MDIESIPAGREMDALVAEKVMGWTWNRSCTWYDTPYGTANREQIPDYSTSISAAWEVVEKLAESNLVTNVSPCKGVSYEFNPKRVAFWKAQINKCDDFGKILESLPSSLSFKSAAEAICRAALWAVETK